MKNQALLAALILSLSGCATSLSNDAARVRIVNERGACTFVGNVNEGAGMGLAKRESAMNKALNRTADLGGNAFYLIREDMHLIDGAFVRGEALKCDL